MTPDTSSRLSPALQGCLKSIVMAVLSGTLRPSINYGTLQHSAELAPDSPALPQVTAYMDTLARRLSHGEKRILLAPQTLFLQPTLPGSLCFGLVPAGGTLESAATRLFLISAPGNRCMFVEQGASAVSARQRIREEAARRRRVQLAEGEIFAAGLTAITRVRVRELLATITPSEQQQGDIDYVMRHTDPTLPLSMRVNDLRLEELTTILVILGKKELPSYR